MTVPCGGRSAVRHCPAMTRDGAAPVVPLAVSRGSRIPGRCLDEDGCLSCAEQRQRHGWVRARRAVIEHRGQWTKTCCEKYVLGMAVVVVLTRQPRWWAGLRRRRRPTQQAAVYMMGARGGLDCIAGV